MASPPLRHESHPFTDRERQPLQEQHIARDESTDAPSPKPSIALPKYDQKPAAFSRKGWLWETLSLLGSLCCLAAIIGLLAFYDGRTVPDWYYGLTLNALVSVVATVFKGALLVPIASSIGQLAWVRLEKMPYMRLDSFCVYDRASRGPWGSVRFIAGSHIL